MPVLKTETPCKPKKPKNPNAHLKFFISTSVKSYTFLIPPSLLITQNYNKLNNKFQNIIQFCSSIDILQNMCYIAKKHKYYKPTLCEGDKSYVIAKQLRHPLIEKMLQKL